MRTLSLVGLWAALLAGGAWATSVYSDYLDIMRDAVGSGDYGAAAARLAAVTAAEPDLALYHGQRGYLLGLAARAGDRAAAAEAIASYTRAAALDPYFAPYHANLAALLWNTGQLEEGFAAMQRAAELAPDSWSLQYTLGLYAEALGRPDAAAAAYDRALAANPDADLYLAWGATSLQAARRSAFAARAPLTQVALLLEGGQVGEALAVWDAQLSSAGTPAALVLRALLDLATGDRDAALSWLAQARAAAEDDDPWVLLGAARLARFDGDASGAADLLARASSAAQPGPLEPDDPFAGSVAYAQYHRQALERYFLPQVYYPTADAALVYLLERGGSR
jgi:tetratricopeptide (TPR) repeat protein